MRCWRNSSVSQTNIASRFIGYWFTLPVISAVADGRSTYHFNADYESFLNDLETRHYIIILQREFLIWNEANFLDQTHLNSVGAERISKLLGEKLFGLQKHAK